MVVATRTGAVWFIELKLGRRHPLGPHQKAVIDWLQAHGHNAMVLRADRWDEREFFTRLEGGA